MTSSWAVETSRSNRAAARAVAEPAGPGQLRAPDRGGRELTAFLISAAPDLRVLTTSRAPLAIAGEHVYPLGELGTGDAAQLFRERAVAARPGARLTEQAVASIVSRLDGLPLAIELAAARAGAMSVEEIDRRLDDRFALLRGGDRSAPDRGLLLAFRRASSGQDLSADTHV
jgi:predicted ATPase